VQKTLQAVSRSLYSSIEVESHLQPIVTKAWSMLPEPAVKVDVDLNRLNWFVSTDRFLATRKARLSTVIDALKSLAAGESLSRKVITTRYTMGLPQVDVGDRQRLLQFLMGFVTSAES
jgi:hypothetical protein